MGPKMLSLACMDECGCGRDMRMDSNWKDGIEQEDGFELEDGIDRFTIYTQVPL